MNAGIGPASETAAHVSGPSSTEAIIAGLEANIREAALQLGESSRLIRQTTQDLYLAQATVTRQQGELTAMHAELEEARRQADGWEKVAQARASEVDRLHRLIRVGDDGVSPE